MTSLMCLFLTCLSMVLPNEHTTPLILFDGKRYFSPFVLLRIIASGSRTSQCINNALLGETSRAHFPVSSHSTYSLGKELLRQYNAYHALINSSRVILYRQEPERPVETLPVCNCRRRACLLALDRQAIFTRLHTCMHRLLAVYNCASKRQLLAMSM